MSCGKSPLPFISMESCEVGKGISNHAKPTKQFLWPISNVTEITVAGRGGLIWTDTSPYRGLPKAAERCKHSRLCWVCPGASSWEDMAETTQLWSLLMWRSRESNLTPYWMIELILSLRESLDTLWKKLISSICIHRLIVWSLLRTSESRVRPVNWAFMLNTLFYHNMLIQCLHDCRCSTNPSVSLMLHSSFTCKQDPEILYSPLVAIEQEARNTMDRSVVCCWAKTKRQTTIYTSD